MLDRLRQIMRRRRIRFLKIRAKEAAAKALLWMQYMEDDLRELRHLTAYEPGVAHLTELEIDAALEAIA